MADGRNVEGDLPGLFADDRVRIDERTVRIALQRARTAVLDRAARFDVEMAVAGAERDADGRIRFPEKFCRETRSEEHKSELKSLMRNTYTVYCLKKKNKINNTTRQII